MPCFASKQGNHPCNKFNTGYITKEKIDEYLLEQEDNEISDDFMLLKEECNKIDNFIGNELKQSNNDFKILNNTYYEDNSLLNAVASNYTCKTTHTIDLKNDKNKCKNSFKYEIPRVFDMLEEIYLHIDFGREITQDDIYKLINMKLDIEIGGSVIFKYDVGNDLELLGELNDVTTFYGSIDLLIVTSRAEGFPNVIAEAMACGCPCVSTDVGEARVIIGNTGKLFHVGDLKELVGAVNSFYRMPGEEWKACRLGARNRIASIFPQTRCNTQFADLYADILKRK